MPDTDAEPTSAGSLRPGRLLVLVGLAVAAALPGAIARLSGAHVGSVAGLFLFGFGIVGAAFLLAWGAEALQIDVSQGLALAVLALIAVLPEYFVDFTFAWKAGSEPDRYAPLALANMTGSNRLLIGIGWSAVVLLAAWRLRRTAREERYTGPLDTEVRLDRSHAIEITFLAVATLYSLSLPFRSVIGWWDSAVLIALFGAYFYRIGRSPAEEPHLVGPARLFALCSPAWRRTAVAACLGFSALVIVLCAEPFAESLIGTGTTLGISTFVLVQWLAPLASEAPELLVACLFAWRLNTNGGLGTLVSSKVNQWTLLVGSLPLVFLVAGGLGHGLPIDALQREELFLTAAQSAFAVAVLCDRRLNVREAWMLLGLFLGQLVIGAAVPDDLIASERIGFGVLYLLLAAWYITQQRRSLRPLAHDGLRADTAELVHEAN